MDKVLKTLQEHLPLETTQAELICACGTIISLWIKTLSLAKQRQAVELIVDTLYKSTVERAEH